MSETKKMKSPNFPPGTFSSGQPFDGPAETTEGETEIGTLYDALISKEAMTAVVEPAKTVINPNSIVFREDVGEHQIEIKIKKKPKEKDANVIEALNTLRSRYKELEKQHDQDFARSLIDFSEKKGKLTKNQKPWLHILVKLLDEPKPVPPPPPPPLPNLGDMSKLLAVLPQRGYMKLETSSGKKLSLYRRLSKIHASNSYGRVCAIGLDGKLLSSCMDIELLDFITEVIKDPTDALMKYGPVEKHIGDFTKLHALFDKAREKLEYPHLFLMTSKGNKIKLYRLKDNRFAVVRGHMRNFDGSEIGKIDQSGIFKTSYRSEADDIVELLEELIEDPLTALARLGRLQTFCCHCALTLSDERSLEAGYGPVCAKNWGLPWKKKFQIE